MYNGRCKFLSVNSSILRLAGILGPISVLTMPLIRTTDIPEEIWTKAIVDLPVVDLITDKSYGELLAGDDDGLVFAQKLEDEAITTAARPMKPT